MAKYGIFLTPDKHHIVAMKTTVASPADGDWDNQDNVILPAGGSPIKSMWAVEDGSDIHVATQQESGRVAYHVFDPGTDTWTTVDELVATAGETNFDEAPDLASVSLALRSDGDVIVFYSVGESGDSVVDLLYARREGGAWTTNILVFTHSSSLFYRSPVAVGPDSSDRITCIVSRNNPPTNNVHTRSLSSTNVLGTDIIVDSGVDTGFIVNGPGVIDDNNKIYVPYIDADNQISIASWTSDASPSISLDTTLTARTVFGHGRTSPAFVAACMTLEGDTDAHLVFYDDTDHDIYHEDDVDGATGSDTKIEDLEIPLRLYAWGLGSSGQLGDNTIVSKSSPVQTGSDTDWVYVTAGNSIMLAVKRDATLWSWGTALNGNLGNGTSFPDISSPVQVGSDTDWATVSNGTSHTHATRTDGTLWSWGDAEFGALGNDDDTTDLSTPVQIGTLETWTEAQAGDNFGVARKSDGTLWAWGLGTTGQLGDLSTTSKSSPVQVASATDWVIFAVGNLHTLAINTNDELWGWGSAITGRLGDGTTTSKSSPVQIGSDTDWADVSCGSAHTLAVRTDGTLWAWGSNSSGRLGDGTTVSKSSPIQIGSDTDWESVSCGSAHTLAVRTDGTLWAWGSGSFGALGNGQTQGVSSPVQIGSLTSWSSVEAGSSLSSGIQGRGVDNRISANVIA